jgi:hypothetical protein
MKPALSWMMALVVVLGLTGYLSAQDVDVHIAPRPAPTPTPKIEVPASDIPGVATDPGLKINHGKPMQVDVDLVLVNVTVTDDWNRIVTGLDKENFAVLEGNEPQLVKRFSSEDAPLSLGVIFDMSGSMSDKITKAREAVVEFMKTANPQDEFFMITFNDRPQLRADFTTCRPGTTNEAPIIWCASFSVSGRRRTLPISMSTSALLSICTIGGPVGSCSKIQNHHSTCIPRRLRFLARATWRSAAG